MRTMSATFETVQIPYVEEMGKNLLKLVRFGRNGQNLLKIGQNSLSEVG